MRPVITCYGYALPIFAGLFRCFGAKGLGLRKRSRARSAAKARVAPATSLLARHHPLKPSVWTSSCYIGLTTRMLRAVSSPLVNAASTVPISLPP